MKIKILKTPKDSPHCYECGGSDAVFAGIMEWDEVDEATYWELDKAVREANSNHREKYHYLLLQQLNKPDYQEIFQSAKDYLDHVKKEQKRWEREQREQKAKRKKAALARKEKMLEKLRAELEDLRKKPGKYLK